MSDNLKIHSLGLLTPPDEPGAAERPGVFLTGTEGAVRKAASCMCESVVLVPADEITTLTAKLAKAMKALREIAENGEGFPNLAGMLARDARHTLSELEDSHE